MKNFLFVLSTILLALLWAVPGCIKSDEANGDAGQDGASDADIDADGDSDTDQNPPCHRYVNISSDASKQDGLSWNTPFRAVQRGIDSAADSGDPCQVWVAKGRYYIFNDTWQDTIQLRPRVYLYGGFVGGETKLIERHPKRNETILDGHNQAGDNQVFHVVTGSDSAILDGFTVTGGNARGNDPDFNGGGLYSEGSCPVVRNCVFIDNWAMNKQDSSGRGGGIYIRQCDNVRILDCVFRQNLSLGGAGVYVFESAGSIEGSVFMDNNAELGGGLITTHSPGFRIVDTRFISNHATLQAGGVYNDDEPVTFERCVFALNTGGSGGGIHDIAGVTLIDSIFSGNISTMGGGIESRDGQITAQGCVFAGNTSTGQGGGVDYDEGTIGTSLTDCVFAGNTAAAEGGGVFNHVAPLSVTNCTFSKNVSQTKGGGVYSDGFSTVTLSNSISWGDSPKGIDKGDAIINASHSDVQNGGFSSDGNIDEDPLFNDPAVTGTWTAITYDEATYQTAFEDATKSWTKGALAGSFVETETSVDPSGGVDGDADGDADGNTVTGKRWLYIVDNTANQILLWGDYTSFGKVGESYAIVSSKLTADSPCIDAADDAVAPDMDVLGQSRVDVAGKGADGVLADMGAYEFVP